MARPRKDYTRKILLLLLDGEKHEYIAAITGVHVKTVSRIQHHYMKKTITLSLNDEGQKYIHGEQLYFHFPFSEKVKATMGIRKKLGF